MGLDFSQFHNSYFDESFEALDSMEAAVLKIDAGSPEGELINTIFRVAHSIKGGSATFGFSQITSFTHSLETLLDELRAGRIRPSGAICDLLLGAVDILRAMLQAVRDGQPIDMQRVTDVQFDIELTISQKEPPAVSAAGALACVPEAPVRPEAINAEAGSIRVKVEKIDGLIDTLEELIITHSILSQLSRSIAGPQAERLSAALAQQEHSLRQLQEGVMRVRMLPISVVFCRLPRMVRDLAQRLGKRVELQITGETLELDKTVLEKIGDPLMHLVRNSIDHGIEKPAARIAAGKSAGGVIRLSASHRGGDIAVEVRDDGNGLDYGRILERARALGLLGPGRPTQQQIHQLIFLPGLSTAQQTTDVSGRGVGMDVVRRNIADLGGKIEVRSERGGGAHFIITLPLTPSIVQGPTVTFGARSIRDGHHASRAAGLISSIPVREDQP